MRRPCSHRKVVVSAAVLLASQLIVSGTASAQEPTPPAPPSDPAANTDVDAGAGADAAAAAPEPTTPAPPPTEPATAPSTTTTTTTTGGPITKPVQLRHNLWIDLPVTAAMVGGILAWGFIKADFPNRTCTICDGPGTDTNGFDGFWRDSFKADKTATPAALSHIISYGVSPAMGVALTIGVAAADRRTKEAGINALLVVEASIAAVVVKEALTYAVRRERPQVHALEGVAKEKEIEEQSDPLESFPGGHTASIMAITASAGIIAHMRGYRFAPIIWVVGSTLAAFVTYLRIASDQHYMTDNLTGIVVGAGVGVGVPLLFHRPVDSSSTSSANAKPTGLPSWGTRPLFSTGPSANGGRVINLTWAF